MNIPNLTVPFPDQNIFYTNSGYFSFLNKYGIKRKIKQTYEVNVDINQLSKEAYLNLFYDICDTFHINPRIIHSPFIDELDNDNLYEEENTIVKEDKIKGDLNKKLDQLGLKIKAINNQALITLEKEELIAESIVDEKRNYNYRLGLPLDYTQGHIGTFSGLLENNKELLPLKRYLIQIETEDKTHEDKTSKSTIIPIYSCITDYELPLRMYVGLCNKNLKVIYSPNIKGELAKIGEGN